MSGGYVHIVEIQPVDQEVIPKSQGSTSNVAETLSNTFTHILGVTNETQLLEELMVAEAINKIGTKGIKIQKVPTIMRRNGDLEEYFKPRELSFGPIHAAAPNLFKKNLKHQLAAHFLNEDRKVLEELFKEFKSAMQNKNGKILLEEFLKEFKSAMQNEDKKRLMEELFKKFMSAVHDEDRKKLMEELFKELKSATQDENRKKLMEDLFKELRSAMQNKDRKKLMEKLFKELKSAMQSKDRKMLMEDLFKEFLSAMNDEDRKKLMKELFKEFKLAIQDEHRKKLMELFKEFKSEMRDIKMYFEEEVVKPYNDEELILLLFLDGCAILGFIKSYFFGSNQFNNGQEDLIVQDMFLLENQIPLKVLDYLLSKITLDSDYLSMDGKVRHWLEIFIVASNSIFPRDHIELIYANRYKREKDQYAHLLALQRGFVVAHHDSNYPSRNLITRTASKFFSFLFCRGVVAKHSEYWSEEPFYRHIQELQAAGIKFKPTDSLRGISFHSKFSITGQLELPTLVVADWTSRMLLNLVAYEMCLPNTQIYEFNPDDPNNYWVTSYVNLLDLLVDDEQDVKDLRAAGILRNYLSTDSEVAQLINKMGSYCFAPPNDTFAIVRNKIGRHCRKRSAIWMAQVCQNHFSSPWTMLTLFAATMVLGLTAAQTYYAVHPNS